MSEYDKQAEKTEYKDYYALITIPAYNEEDFKEQLDSLDSYDLEWWREVKR